MDYEHLTEKKNRLDQARPLPDGLVRNLDDWFRVELTYTSNAIEGNTLTRRETALVVEKGLTVGGKSLVEHLEATNHAQALDWVKTRVTGPPNAITERDILHIHEMILKGIDDENAGHYRNVPVRISGSAVVLPNPAKVPDLMAEFEGWLREAGDLHPVELATEAHYQLVTIHPFVDGNGRTARLLMNMILLMCGYPAAIIRKRDRLSYITGLETAQLGGPKDGYQKLVAQAVNRSLDIYLKALDGETAVQADEGRLMKIGELAKKSGIAHSTIRHWTREGLLEVADTTPSGYQLFNADMIKRIEKIQELQKQRFSLGEIRERVVEL